MLSRLECIKIAIAAEQEDPMASSFDWLQWEEDHPDNTLDIEENFKELTEVDPDFLSLGDDVDRCECGRYKPSEVACALYRLVFLCGPKSVDFSNFYKSYLFGFSSKDHKWAVAVRIHKGAIGLYFYCPKEHWQSRGQEWILGAPGADNGWACTSPDGNAFFDLIKQLVETPLMIYGGNNFEV